MGYTYFLKNADRSNSGMSQFSGCQRYPSNEKSGRCVILQDHIGDNHLLQPNPEYNGLLLSATHLPLV